MNRELTTEETELVEWLLEHGAADAAALLPQLADTHVVSHCPCGCASIDFAVSGVVPAISAKMEITAD